MAGGKIEARVHSEFLRLAHSGLDSRTLRLRALHQLREIIPIDAFWVATADPATWLFTSAIKEAIPEEAVPRFVENEFLQDDVNKFRVLAASRAAPVSSLYRATENRPETSRRFREILTPLGLGDELRAVFRTGGAVWGYACMHCEAGTHGYTPQHLALLARLAPLFAEGLRNALLLENARRGDRAEQEDSPGLVVLADDLSIAATTLTGERWLAEIGDRTSRLPLPEAVHSVVARLWALERSEAGEEVDRRLPLTRVRTASGRWLVIHASRLSGPGTAGQTAVVLEPAPASEVAPLLLDAYGLTPREREVAQFVLRGMPTAAIAAALLISPLTVQQHLKAVFDKAGVGSRRGLIARVFAEQYQPMVRRSTS
jgi:DNA-binding CsgD family transcriptional regulator